MHRKWRNSNYVGTATPNFGKMKNKSADWFEAHVETKTPVIEEKRKC